MKCALIVKNQNHTLVNIEGREVKPENISLRDMEQIIETENILERLFGYRFHIIQVY